MDKKIIIATRNKDKARELKALLKSAGITARTLDEFDPAHKIPEVEETGATLEENALLKAKTISTILGLPAIADDTGLEVDALDGAPGVYAARYAEVDCSYPANNTK